MERVLILGATSAIAAEVAALHARRGDRLHLVGRNPAKLSAVVARCAGASVAVVASTRDHHAVRTFVKGVQVRFAYWGICQLRR
jgi:short-subunit dehydrogenase